MRAYANNMDTEQDAEPKANGKAELLKYEALTGEQLVHKLGTQCSPHPKYGGYVIGPDINGRICHIGSYRSLAGAQAAARVMNLK